MNTKIFLYLVILLIVPALSGCWLLAAGGAGAYGGYKAKEEGYGLQNPITKEEKVKTPGGIANGQVSHKKWDDILETGCPLPGFLRGFAAK
jgi:hypothetical protein